MVFLPGTKPSTNPQIKKTSVSLLPGAPVHTHSHTAPAKPGKQGRQIHPSPEKLAQQYTDSEINLGWQLHVLCT